MTDEQRSERMTEDQVHAKALEMWPTVKGWVGSGPAPTPPAPGSQLAEDDAQTRGMHLSHLVRISPIRARSWSQNASMSPGNSL